MKVVAIAVLLFSALGLFAQVAEPQTPQLKLDAALSKLVQEVDRQNPLEINLTDAMEGLLKQFRQKTTTNQSIKETLQIAEASRTGSELLVKQIEQARLAYEEYVRATGKDDVHAKSIIRDADGAMGILKGTYQTLEKIVRGAWRQVFQQSLPEPLPSYKDLLKKI